MTNLSTDLHDVEKIIVLDYGSQYNQLISRRIREIGVFSELKSHKISADEVRAINPVGIVLSGGPNSVYEEGSLISILKFLNSVFQSLESVTGCNY